jgi:hypothetical protein
MMFLTTALKVYPEISPAVVSVLELNLEPKTSVFCIFLMQVIVFYFVTDIIFGLVVSLI